VTSWKGGADSAHGTATACKHSDCVKSTAANCESDEFALPSFLRRGFWCQKIFVRSAEFFVVATTVALSRRRPRAISSDGTDSLGYLFFARNPDTERVSLVTWE
jgi:hypothetical protein